MDPPPQTISILHIDDDGGFRDLAVRAFQRASDRIEVTSVAAAPDGLATLYDDEAAIDCVVSDYDMPEMNGLELLVAVRSEFPDLPFVLFTGKGTEEIASRAISAGVTDYLQKGGGIDQFEVLANRLEIYVERARDRARLEYLERELTFWKEFSPAVVLIDAAGRVHSASATCRDLFGVDHLDELVGRAVETLVHPDERDDIAAVMREVRHDGGARTCRNRTFVRVGGESLETTVQWRSVDHWGQASLLAVMNDFPAEGAPA